MSTTVSRFVSKAQQSARAGRRDAAERNWLKVLDLEPQHTQALTALGIYALDSGDTKRALSYLEASRLTAPTDLHVLIPLCAARRAAGDDDGEFEAIQWALAVDPGSMEALLLKGAWHERHGDAAAACAVYARALENAPPEQRWPAKYRHEFAHARAFVAGYTRALHDFLNKEVARSAPDDTVRWREAASIRAGRSQPFDSRSTRLHVPRLPAIPFFDPGEFSFADELTVNTMAIRDEVQTVMDRHNELFEPLIAFALGEPVAQWEQLNHSTRYTALHLWRGGMECNQGQAACPRTLEVTRELSLFDLTGIGPNVYFSVLAPGTQVPPNHGQTNARVIVYLPLMANGEVTLRVGYEERQIEEGGLLVFDDTVEHEMSNPGGEDCVVLVFDVWNPLLDAEDRKMIDTLHRAAQSFPVPT